MLTRRPKERQPEQKDPGDVEGETCSPGSIEQQLDMCESGSLRGDDILHNHGRSSDEMTTDNQDLSDFMEVNYRMDMSEENREGDDMSGEDHSSGLQGEETEIKGQHHIDSGVPGENTQGPDQADFDHIVEAPLAYRKGGRTENVRSIRKKAS